MHYLSYIDFLDNHPESELLLVDDGSGSGEGTAELARKLSAEDKRVRVLQFTKHRGKGAACKAGVEAAKADRVLLCDCDLATPLSEYDRMAELLRDNDLVIGSRRTTGARIAQPQPQWRQLAGQLGNIATRKLLGLPYLDTQCGFKLLGPACLPLLAAAKLRGAGFDFELLLLAKLAHLKVAEVGVEWREKGDSRFGLWSFAATFGELLTLAASYGSGRLAARMRRAQDSSP